MIKKVKPFGESVFSSSYDHEWHEVFNEQTGQSGLGVCLNGEDELFAWSEIDENNREVKLFVNDTKEIDYFENFILEDFRKKHDRYTDYNVQQEYIPTKLH